MPGLPISGAEGIANATTIGHAHVVLSSAALSAEPPMKRIMRMGIGSRCNVTVVGASVTRRLGVCPPPSGRSKELSSYGAYMLTSASENLLIVYHIQPTGMYRGAAFLGLTRVGVTSGLSVVSLYSLSRADIGISQRSS